MEKWIKNDGKQPVLKDTLVEVKLCNGTLAVRPAGTFYWSFAGYGGDITHWKLHTEPSLENAYDNVSNSEGLFNPDEAVRLAALERTVANWATPGAPIKATKDAAIDLMIKTESRTKPARVVTIGDIVEKFKSEANNPQDSATVENGIEERIIHVFYTLTGVTLTEQELAALAAIRSVIEMNYM